jgi:hypothetical protein
MTVIDITAIMVAQTTVIIAILIQIMEEATVAMITIMEIVATTETIAALIEIITMAEAMDTAHAVETPNALLMEM